MKRHRSPFLSSLRCLLGLTVQVGEGRRAFGTRERRAIRPVDALSPDTERAGQADGPKPIFATDMDVLATPHSVRGPCPENAMIRDTAPPIQPTGHRSQPFACFPGDPR